MPEMRVQCPNCMAKMKLTAAVEKVRCPKCDTLFKAAENKAQPVTAKSSPSRSRTKQSTPDPFGFTDEAEDDLFGAASSKPDSRSPRKASRQPKPRRQQSRKPKAGAIPDEQVRKFGFTMIALGVGAFILPLIGLQIKGLHAMTPEMQSLGGICFFILGLAVLAAPFIRNFSPAMENGFQLVKWGAIGLFALLIGGPVLLLIGRLLFSAVGGGGDEANDAHRIAQEMHEKAQEQHRQTVRQMQQNHDNFMNSNRADPVSRPIPSTSTTQNNSVPMNTETTTSETMEPVSPFQEVSPEPESPFQVISESDSTTKDSNSSAPSPSPFAPIAQQTNNFSQTEQTVAVILNGFSRGETIRHIRDLRSAAESFRMRVVKMEDGAARIEFDAVKDTQTFADRISFGKVTNVDTTRHEITLEK